MPIRVFILPFMVPIETLTSEGVFLSLELAGGPRVDHASAAILALQPTAIHPHNGTMKIFGGS